MQRLPRRLRLYILLAPLLGVALFLLTLLQWRSAAWTQPAAGLAVLFFALTALAENFPVLLLPASHAGSKFTVATASIYAALLVSGAPIAVLIAVGSQALADLRLRRRWYNALFNAGQNATAVSAAGLLCYAIEPRRLPVSPGSLHAGLALTATALVLYLANSWLVVTASALQAGRNPLRLWLQQRRWSILQEIALYLLGLLGVIAVHAYAWALLLLIVPVAAVYWSFRSNLLGADAAYQLLLDLADVVDARGNPGHGLRVAERATELAKRLGMTREQAETVRLAARIHDIGQLNLDAADLPDVPGGAQPAAAIRRHTEVGRQLAERVPRYRFTAPLILHHHERYDGAGLPSGLRGDAIPLGARVIAAADAWDDLTRGRAVDGAALEALRAQAGSSLDPHLVALLTEIVRDRA